MCQKTARSLFSITLSFPQTKTQTPFQTVLSLKVMPLKTALQFQPSPIEGVSQPTGAFVSTQTPLCVTRSAPRGALFCSGKTEKDELGVRTGCNC